MVQQTIPTLLRTHSMPADGCHGRISFQPANQVASRMENTPCAGTRARFSRRMTIRLVWALCATIVTATLPTANAGHFFSDFNDGLPPRTKASGDASIEPSGGVGETGMLKLTANQNSWVGTFFLDPLDDKAVSSFTAQFKIFIGGGSGADGFGFHFGEFPDARIGEAPFTNEFTVTFDTFQNGPSEVAPGIRVYFKNKELAAEPVPNLRANKFVDVLIKLDRDGSLDVAYDDVFIFTDLATEATNIVGRFALGARVGDQKDYHLVDDLSIDTQTSGPYIDNFGPIDDNASPSPIVEILLRDFATKPNTHSIQLKFDDQVVVPDVSRKGEGEILVNYQPPELLDPGSSHTVSVKFSDDNKPSATGSLSYRFKISSQVKINR